MGVEREPSLTSENISTAVCDALQQVELLAPFFADKTLLTVDLETVRAAIRKADASDKRAQLEAVMRSMSALEKLAPSSEEEAESKAIQTHIGERDNALKITNGPLFLRLYEDVHQIFKAGYDEMVCPACEHRHLESQDELIKKRLETYEKVSTEQIKTLGSLLRKRLQSLESGSDLVIPSEEQKLLSFDKLFSSGEASDSDLSALLAHLGELEKTRTRAFTEKAQQKDKLQKELPPSLVAVMEQMEAAQSTQTSLAEMEKLGTRQKALSQLIALKQRWIAFVTYAERIFAQAEIALSTAKTTAFESEYRKIYERITANPSIVPVLQKAKGSEELRLRLEKFYTLADTSAATLLPESYRNALAISIYITAALQSAKASRFIVLDDVTSSFDAGHQFNLMQVLHSEVLYPQNPTGLQVILFSHDGLLEKYFDKMSEEMGWNHYRLDGLPPCGNVLTTRQDSQRIKADAERFLNAGQVLQAKPLIRQYLEYSLLRVIRKLGIPVPLDFAIRDEAKLPQACLDAINEAIELHSKASSLVLSAQQLNDWRNVCVPQIVGNFLAHYATGVGASIAPQVYLSVLSSIDNAVNCFTYECTCGTAPRRLFYRSLSQKPKDCHC